MAPEFHFSRQPGNIKKKMYTRFMALVPISEDICNRHRGLVMEMLEATDPRDEDTNSSFEGRRWLWEYCMRARAGVRTRKAGRKKSRVRGRAHDVAEQSSGGSQQSQQTETAPGSEWAFSFDFTAEELYGQQE
ncbi:hypothetical protein ABW21_db0205159 [Orbilia brochopaga]|nr:hypothetical protein ABW21_db0205159 [Drechslerella brochopaga]